MKRKYSRIRALLLDAAAAGAALLVFALFHHVLPREQQALNLQTVNTAQAAVETATLQATAEATEEAPATAEMTETLETAKAAEAAETFHPADRTTASAGKSDTGSRGNSGKTGKGSRSGGAGSSKGGMNSNGKGGSALTDSGEVPADTGDEVPLSEKFADRFTDTVVATENTYTSPDIAVSVEKVEEGSLTYYVADIYVRDIACFRTALAGETYGSGFRDSIGDMAALNDALLAVNGDYYGNTSEGVVIRNGVIYRANATNCDVCVLYYDGRMKVMPGSSFSVEEAIADGAWQAWTFGPALLDTDGSVLTEFASTNRIISANPRTAIGYYEPGHYCLVVVDGRGESSGITLPQLSKLFYNLGCTAAYNLDGGNSSVMVWGDEVINNPSGGGRESSDALLIAEVRKYE